MEYNKDLEKNHTEEKVNQIRKIFFFLGMYPGIVLGVYSVKSYNPHIHDLVWIMPILLFFCASIVRKTGNFLKGKKLNQDLVYFIQILEYVLFVIIIALLFTI